MTHPFPVRHAVTVTPLGDSTALCWMRPGGQAPPHLQAPPCGTFADWSLTPAEPAAEPGREPAAELLSCCPHLAAGVRHVSDRAEAAR